MIEGKAVIDEIEPVIALEICHDIGDPLLERAETRNDKIDRAPKLRDSPTDKANIGGDSCKDKNPTALDPADGETKGDLENT